MRASLGGDAGTHRLTFVRMDIPTFHKKPNPDYESLLDRFAVQVVDILDVTVAADDIPDALSASHSVVDPGH